MRHKKKMAWLIVESLWFSDKALERGIRRSEVQFLTRNFLCPMLVENTKKNHLSLTVVLIFIGQKEIPDIQLDIAGYIEDGPKLDPEDFIIDVSMAMECVLLLQESD